MAPSDIVLLIYPLRSRIFTLLLLAFAVVIRSPCLFFNSTHCTRATPKRHNHSPFSQNCDAGTSGSVTVSTLGAMPSKDGKSSASCCTSRTPPSPDGDPPRPAVSLSKSQNQQMGEIVSSGSTGAAEAAELRPIFEANPFDTEAEKDKAIGEVKVAISSKFRTVLLGDKVDADGEWEQMKPRKSTNTLNAVKHIIKKRLSRESALAKRRSVSSVGTTEEEVERRAELKRIRHKRIKEELSNEASYDEDAKSISSVAEGDTTRGPTVNASWVLGDPLPLPHLLGPSLSYPELPYPELPLLEE